MSNYLKTGLRFCYDEAGATVDCPGSGQDAEFKPGEAAPYPRFEERQGIVLDCITGLNWSRNANASEYPLSWPEALEFIQKLNKTDYLGRDDWRLPNRREMRSLVNYQNRKPALDQDHPFENVFLNWYWTGTTAAVNKAYAWYVHLEGGRMFYGKKSQYYLVWPVCEQSHVLPATGQKTCFDASGKRIPCSNCGQDGELQTGVSWPQPRFEVRDDEVFDNLTNLCWTRNASLTGGNMNWQEAFDAVSRLNQDCGRNKRRLPTINELESLVDARCHNPALPLDHPFINVGEIYVSSTTSGFEPDWCMLLHLHKGAVGVGQKKQKGFSVWAVRAQT